MITMNYMCCLVISWGEYPWIRMHGGCVEDGPCWPTESAQSPTAPFPNHIQFPFQVIQQPLAWTKGMSVNTNLTFSQMAYTGSIYKPPPLSPQKGEGSAPLSYLPIKCFSSLSNYKVQNWSPIGSGPQGLQLPKIAVSLFGLCFYPHSQSHPEMNSAPNL